MNKINKSNPTLEIVRLPYSGIIQEDEANLHKEEAEEISKLESRQRIQEEKEIKAIRNKLNSPDKKIKSMKEIRNHFEDHELCGLPKTSKLDVKMTPTSFRIGIHNIEDWNQINSLNSAAANGLKNQELIQNANFIIDGKEHIVRLAFYKAGHLQ